MAGVLHSAAMALGSGPMIPTGRVVGPLTCGDVTLTARTGNGSG